MDSTTQALHNGQLLLASPGMHDSMFKKSVILLSNYLPQEEAKGYILNRPSSHCVGDLLKSEKFQALHNLHVHIGGPVDQQKLTFAKIWISQSSNVQYSTQISAHEASQETHQPGHFIFAFAGHSSWTAGQLESEMEDHTWIQADYSKDFLSERPNRDLWAKILRTLSPYHRVLAEAPDDVFIN